MHRIPILLAALLALPSCSADGGSPEPAPGPALAVAVSWDHEVRAIVDSFCTTCHSGSDPEAGLDLTTYEAVRGELEHGDLLARIDDAEDPMPPAGLMPPDLRRTLAGWAADGFPRSGEPADDARASWAGPDELAWAWPELDPVDVDVRGFELLELLGGHWVGDLHLMGTDLDWFAFDYRPIGPAHVHGMFEGGTVGNLFTSFFLARHEGRSVLMARNGGLLNGIYRTSYFLMTEASVAADGRRDYRFVDALGGADIMWIDLSFQGDALEFRSYTSRFGLAGEPSLHMRFRGKRLQRELADQAAAEVGFPARVPQLDLPEGLPVPDWGDEPWVTSASYMTQAEGLDLVALGRAAGDPLRVDQMPHLAELELTLERGPEVAGQPLQVYLSREALTDADGRLRSLAGYLRPDLGNGILLFPEVSAGADGMTFAYLHPGRYHLTVTADLDGDGYPSAGDVTSPSRVVEVRPGGRHAVHVDDVEVRNR